MLDTETKRKIDSCRDILVGKVPDPKGQVEQITIALIYKFMDDMDQSAVEMGGKASFFKGEFKKHAWSEIFDPRIGGHELLNLYSEAINTMDRNPNIPQLFRDIFKNAFLPYRDPETLRAFLKEINGFTYDHSERLGDAFEYLLSVLSSQGDAGQFRTPRHIIDFIVEVVAPQKHETVLDPACGTAGFLISAYKHILKHNPKLSTDQKKRLMANFVGYDISYDMVRLSLVNMYLHGFPQPKIHEYDTLTYEDRWDDTFDVIMANPPFMSPKGGIRPHSRFAIQAKRSEVLFVDYIAEHLNPSGRAGVIVPEGIIFQSQRAYKALRKMLVDNYLWAVVSLPAGIFNPYSGVKTSILFLDKALAKKTDHILFVKTESDGFDLGAQRRPNGKSDLPEALKLLKVYKTKAADFKSGFDGSPLTHAVPKSNIAEDADYNLSGARYTANDILHESAWPMVEFPKVCSLEYGKSLPTKKRVAGPFPVVGSNGITGWHNDYLIEGPAIVVGRKGSAGEVVWIEQNCTPIDTTYYVKVIKPSTTNGRFLYHVLKAMNLTQLRDGAGVPGLNRNDVYAHKKIPLPPLEVQEKIVAEIDAYQKIIAAARQIVQNYKPTIKIDPNWPLVSMKDAPLQIIDGDRGTNYPKKEDFAPTGHCLFLNTKNVRPDGFDFSETMFVSQEKDRALRKGKLARNDIVLTTRGTVGNVAIYDEGVPFEHVRINSGMLIFRPDVSHLIPAYVFHLLQSTFVRSQFDLALSGTAQPQLPIRVLNTLSIPLPPLPKQTAIVAELEAEQKIINSNKKLIEIFENKITQTIAALWATPK